MTQNTYEIYFTLNTGWYRAEHMLVEEAPTLDEAKAQVLAKFPEATNIQGSTITRDALAATKKEQKTQINLAC